MIKKLLKNNKGAFSILAVVIIFTIILATTAFIDITTKSFTLNEIQGIMDTSGINALQNSINTTSLRAEVLAIDPANGIDSSTGTKSLSDYKAKIQTTYNNELRKYIKTNGIIVGITPQQFNVDFTYDKWGQGLTNKNRPQIVLDATYKITVRTSSRFDTITPISKLLYSAREGSNFSVSYGGATNDGNAELIVRSVTREVLR